MSQAQRGPRIAKREVVNVKRVDQLLLVVATVTLSSMTPHSSPTPEGHLEPVQSGLTIADGTGQFAGLRGTAAFSERNAGAWFAGTLAGSLGA
jgi:hypothetical protein